ncbi:hypothetical protein [Microbacterium sp.]|uniref:hypothetical protein n=1 Tax=Microbacterium sp. TaxID=51671 RepID=UPI0033414FB5
MSDVSPAPPRRRLGIGVTVALGFATILVVALCAPSDPPPTLLPLSSAGILYGLAMCVRGRTAPLIEACAAALIGAVFLVSGVIALVLSPGGIVTSLVMIALGVGCGVGAFLHVRAWMAERGAGREARSEGAPAG